MTTDHVLPRWEFDLTDDSLAPRMHEVFGSLRQECPVVHSSRHGGFWAVLSHAAVQQVSSDPATFSSAHGISIPLFSLGVKHPPADFDPPEHTDYRKIIQRHFTRRAVAQYEPMIRGLARARIAEIAQRGHADVVPELALYVPPVAIAAILGLPAEDGLKLVSWTNALFAGPRPATRRRICAPPASSRSTWPGTSPGTAAAVTRSPARSSAASSAGGR